MAERIGATAPQGAGKIHTDFEKGFIRAEVIAYDDYIALGGEPGAKSAGSKPGPRPNPEPTAKNSSIC